MILKLFVVILIFKDRLRCLHEHQELSQADVCQSLGISSSSYSRYECGTNKPCLDVLKKMAILFDCSVDYLLEIDGAVFNTDKVVDLNGFILNEKYTIASRLPTKHDRKIINSFINSIFRSCFNRKKSDNL